MSFNSPLAVYAGAFLPLWNAKLTDDVLNAFLKNIAIIFIIIIIITISAEVF